MGGAIDCQGTPIVAEPMSDGTMVYPTFQNFMYATYNFDGLSCTLNPQFTAGQGKAMRENILGYWANSFDQVRNTIDSLYEPFAITDGNISSNSSNAYSKVYTSNINFTGAIVWNCGPFTMRFQPGFAYEFSNLPNSINIPTSTQFNYPTSSYIGVKIFILSDSTIIKSQAPVCFTSNEPFISGDVKSTYDFGSGIFTEQQLDEIKASNPDFYEELQSQMFHIITKQTESGFSDQKIIFKK